jgi:hypothetical protein
MEAVSSYIIALGVSQAYYLFLYMLQCSYLNTVIVP